MADETGEDIAVVTVVVLFEEFRLTDAVLLDRGCKNRWPALGIEDWDELAMNVSSPDLRENIGEQDNNKML